MSWTRRRLLQAGGMWAGASATLVLVGPAQALANGAARGPAPAARVPAA
jgi:hypothetical protein